MLLEKMLLVRQEEMVGQEGGEEEAREVRHLNEEKVQGAEVGGANTMEPMVVGLTRLDLIQLRVRMLHLEVMLQRIESMEIRLFFRS